MGNQRRANRIRQSLEENAFDGNCYAFEIDIEGLQSIPNYVDELREILCDGIAVHRTDEFVTVRKMVLHSGQQKVRLQPVRRRATGTNAGAQRRDDFLCIRCPPDTH